MKKTFLGLMGVVLACANAFAIPIDAETALRRAFNDSHIRIKGLDRGNWQYMDVIEKNEDAAIYLFTQSNRFLAVSADTKAPAVLGYSDSTPLMSDGDIAPSCLYWLDFLAERISSMSESESNRNFIPKTEKADFERIEPLVKTTWNQDAPYNNKCPKRKGEVTYTGCVATAMAQAMKYHNWPVTGEGSHSYKWVGLTQKMNFSETTFDWAHMLDSYKGVDYTDQQGDAVALLMRAAGISVNMNYGTDGSGASSYYIAPALGEYFRYDRSKLQYLQRAYFGLREWESIIYNSLKEDGPVIYDGQSFSGGHSYICDGYDGNGYFHFNWGWGGVSDGYFLLDALDPYEQGIGGSASNSGFNFNQDIIVGIRPDKDGKGGEMNGRVVASSSFLLDEDNELSLSEPFEMSMPNNNIVYNVGPGPLSPNTIIGLKFSPVGEGNPYYSVVMSDESVPIGYGFTELPFNFDDEMAEGDYIVTMVYGIDSNDLQPVPVPVYDSPGYRATVSEGKVKFSPISPIILDAISISGPDEMEKIEIEGGKVEFKFSVQVENPSEKPLYTTVIGLIVDNENYICAQAYPVVADFNPEETTEFIYSSPFIGVQSGRFKTGSFKYMLCQETSTAYIPFVEKNIQIVDNLSAVEELGEDELSNVEGPVEVYDVSGRYLGTINADSKPVGTGAAKIIIRKQGSQVTKSFSW